MNLGQQRTGQDNDFYPRDSYTKLFNTIKEQAMTWFPFARRPFDIMTVVSVTARTALLKRGNDLQHNGFPYPSLRPIRGLPAASDRVVVANDPQGPFILGMLSGDDESTSTATFTLGGDVTSVTPVACTMHKGFLAFATGVVAPIAGELLMVITFANAGPHIPAIFVQDNSGNLNYGITSPSASSFGIIAPPGGLPASSTYYLSYLVEF